MSPEFQGESVNQRQVQTTAEEQNALITQNELLASLRPLQPLPNELVVEVIDGDNDTTIFPASIRVNYCDRQMRLTFDQTKFEALQVQYGDATPENDKLLEQLYIGAGLITETLIRSLRTDTDTVEQFFSKMSDPSGLFGMAWENQLMQSAEFFESLREVICGDEDRLAAINALRFSIGCFVSCQPNPKEVVEQLIAPAQKGLGNRFELYFRSLRAFKVDPKVISRTFAEHMSELDLAMAFPMDEREVRTVIGSCL